MPSALNLILSLLPAFFLAFFAIGPIIYFSNQFSLYDIPNERKIHKKKISRLGGLAIFLGFCVAILFTYIQNEDFLPKNNYLILGGLLAFLTGFFDDIFHNIRARYKLTLHLISGLMVALSGHSLSVIQISESHQLSLGFWGYPLTILWVAGFINAVNLLDGLDGLAGGVLFIALCFLAALGYMQENPRVLLLSLAGAIGTLAFLFYNFPPAKIFMGDGGAYFLGYLYAIIPLLGIKKTASVTVLLFPLALFLIPVLDMFQVMQKRVKNKEHIFFADKKHIHHRLLHLGFSTKGILWLLYGYTFILGLFSLLMTTLNAWQNWTILILLLAITILVFYTVSVAEDNILSKKENQEKQKKEKKGKLIKLPETKKQKIP